MKKKVIITGVSSGIGQATAASFTKEGWDVFGISRKEPEEMNILAHHFQADISNWKNINRVFDEISSYTNSIDALVNNAALQICKSIVDTSIEEWDTVFATNVRAAFLCSKNAYPLLQKNGGAIVNVSSVHAIATSNNIGAYTASKGALLSFTRAAAIEFGRDNIRVNAVLPGAIDTPMLREGLVRDNCLPNDQELLLKNLSEKNIIKRIGKSEDIAKAIYFLADNNFSSFVTGQGLIVDGGALCRLSTE